MERLLLLLAIFCASVCRLGAENIKPGYHPAGGKRGMCYKMFGATLPDRKDWDGAKASCEAQGAKLATYVDAEEHAGFMSAIKATKTLGWRNDYSIWLGVSDKSSAGNWITTDGDAINKYVSSTWNHGEPFRRTNGYTDKDVGARCVMKWRLNDRLRDIVCHPLLPYACMYQCEPEKADAPQPKEYKPFYSAGGSDGKCFKAVYKPMPQAEASHYCASEGAQLAYLSDSEEMEHVRTLMRHESDGTLPFYLDGTDADKDGDFIYSDGCTLYGYMAMVLAQSSETAARGGCVSIHYDKDQDRTPVVENADCSTPRRFACMYQCGKAAAGAKKTCEGGVTTAKPSAAFKPGYNTAPHGKRGMCYKATPEKKTNEEAAALCAKDGAALANFADEAEWIYLVSLKGMKDTHYWLDGSTIKSKGKFAFSDGTDFTHASTKFSAGNPDNWKGMESCLSTDGKGQNTLNDSDCARDYYFFCMYKCK